MNTTINDTTINVRIDSKTKKAAHKTFEALGLDVSTAVKMFLRRAVATNSIPFEVRAESGFTPEQEQEIIGDTEYAIKNARGFKTAKELHDHILCR